jgi:phosphohistidine phosphatase SixA
MGKHAIKFLSHLGIVWLTMFVTANSAHASDELWLALKQGGKVVLMRHAPVERGTGSGNPLLRDPSCKRERNLSDEGRRAAEEVGRRFKERGIPVEQVLHSPFCRTTETARIAFGAASGAEYLSLLEIVSSDDAARQAEKLNQIVGSYTDEGNLVLITHEPNINPVSFATVRHLDFVVLEPTGGAEFEELGVIRFAESELIFR